MMQHLGEATMVQRSGDSLCGRPAVWPPSPDDLDDPQDLYREAAAQRDSRGYFYLALECRRAVRIRRRLVVFFGRNAWGRAAKAARQWNQARKAKA